MMNDVDGVMALRVSSDIGGGCVRWPSCRVGSLGYAVARDAMQRLRVSFGADACDATLCLRRMGDVGSMGDAQDVCGRWM